MGDIQDAVTEAVERANSEADKDRSNLNTVVALLVAISATLMALCNVKDGNVVQNMQSAQNNVTNAWNFYQAKSTKQHLAENMIQQLSIQRELAANLTPELAAKLDHHIGEYRKSSERYDHEKGEIKKTAEGFQKEYDELNIHDDQLDMAEAGFSISIALFGITALTQKRWLLLVGIAFSTLGVVFGLAGFLKWGLHPDFVAKLLG
jgi:DNA repair ATPase RecN